jgi:hypothetical protein
MASFALSSPTAADEAPAMNPPMGRGPKADSRSCQTTCKLP